MARLRSPAFISLLTVTALGVALYLPTLKLLLFWDDVPHFLWLATQRNGGYWLSSQGFPFYRPSTFAAWELFYRLYGYHNPQALHTLSLILHLTNGWLVALLGTRISGQFRAGLWAGIIFVAFPFSYQTVIPTAAHFHLWLVLALLAASWLLMDWLEKGGQWRLGVAWLLAFWAVFSHENGVLAPLLIGGLLCLSQWRGDVRRIPDLPWRKLRLALAPIVGFAASYALLWLVVPKSNESSGLQLAAMDVKIGQTLQAIGFPIAAAFQLFLDPASVTLWVWVSGLLVIGVVLARLIHNSRLQSIEHLTRNVEKTTPFMLFSLAWIPLVMLPAWLLLDVNYLLGSPRLHYLASVGIAWLWGATLENLLAVSPVKRWIIGSLGTAICLIVAVPFIRARVDEHRLIDRIYREAASSLTSSIEPTDRLLLINGPAYLAPRESTFLLGAEGSTYLPDFINLHDWLALNRFLVGSQADNRKADDIIPATGMIFAVTHPGLDRTTVGDYDRVGLVIYRAGQFHTLLVGEKLAENAASASPLGDFGNGVQLQAAVFSPEFDHLLPLELNWQLASPSPAPVGVFVHLLCDGQMVTQADGLPVGSVHPFAFWQVGERWRDIRYFELPDDPPRDCLQAFVGLYDATNGSRLLLQDSTDGVTIDLP